MSSDRSPAASTTPAPRAAEPAGADPWRLALVLGVGLVIWWLPRPADIEDPRAWQLVAIFVATVLGIIVKPLPMGAIAVLGITVAVLTRTLTVKAALSGFSDNTVWLVFAAFLMGAGFIKTGLGERIAYRLVSLFGGSTLGLSYSLAATDLVLAPAVASNTARAGGVMYPIVRSICETAIEENAERGLRTSAFLMLTAYHANVITSAMFLTANGANPLVVKFAAVEGIGITWLQWAYAGVVPGLVSLALVPMLISRLLPPGAVQTPEAPRLAATALRTLGPMKREERLLAVISIAVVAAWIYGPPLGIDITDTAWTTVAALTGLSLLLVVGVLTWGDVLRNQEAWNTLVWFGTLLMMASQLQELGFIDWFSGRVQSMFVDVHWMAGFLGLGLIYFYSHYFFASSAAHVNAMFPAFLAVGLALGTPPLLAALVLGFFGSLFAVLTHYGGAAAPILFGSGYVALGSWWRIGLIISVVEIVIWLGLGGLWWRLIGIW